MQTIRSTGIGINYERYDYAIAPVWFEARFNLLDKSITPFAAGHVGYGVSMTDDFSAWYSELGGFHAGARIGLQKYFTANTGFSASIGYKHQQTKVTQHNDWNEFNFTEYNFFHSLELRIGFIFQ